MSAGLIKLLSHRKKRN